MDQRHNSRIAVGSSMEPTWASGWQGSLTSVDQRHNHGGKRGQVVYSSGVTLSQSKQVKFVQFRDRQMDSGMALPERGVDILYINFGFKNCCT